MWENILDMLNIVWSILFMVFFFGFCIFIHELGHFLVARMCGLHVISFSIGFKKVWAKKIRGVEYRIGCIPLGGYVEIPQIDSSGDSKDESGKPLDKVNPWKRIATVFAGPFFNILFGLALGCLIWIFGIPQDTPKMNRFEVQSIEENSPEWNAGLRKNDVITKLNGKTFLCTWTEFAREIMLNVGEVTLEASDPEGHVKQIVYKPIVNKSVAPRDEIPYPFFRPEIPVIGYPEKGSPAMEAGIQKGDRIISVNGKEIISIEDLEISALYSQGKPMDVEVIRDEKTMRFTVMPKPYPGAQDSSFYQLGVRFEANGGVLRVEKAYDNMPCHGLLLSKDRIIAADGIPMESNLQFIQKVR